MIAEVDCSVRTPTTAYREATQAEADALIARQALPIPVETVRTQAGRVTVGLIDGVSKAVIFAKTMTSSDYAVTFGAQSILGVNLSTSAKTATGFTLNLSVAVSGTIEYIAHEVT